MERSRERAAVELAGRKLVSRGAAAAIAALWIGAAALAAWAVFH
jgi:hypothetical protein